ncbi:MAG: hydantoinase/oxoprolinase family protein [Variibacter sp.]
MTEARFRIAVDIGGTFTDGVAEETGTGRIWVGKCLTTPNDPGEGVSEVVAQLLAKIGGDRPAGHVEEVVHGTTLVTNTLIERKGVKTGVVVTEGCADVLDIRRENRYDLYDLALELPEPLVPPQHRFEATERLSAAGQALKALTDAEIERICNVLAAAKLDSVAICFLHGYVSGSHEARLASELKRRFKNLSVCTSSQVAREIREYERMSTTVANAYVQPLMDRYLGLLGDRLRQAGIPGHLRIMLSSGGFTSAPSAAETPILLLESGPAAGVISAVNTGLEAKIDHILAFDMGGTTAKACVAVGGAPDVEHTFETARVKRFKRGSGLPILIPSIDLIEIGAGGGSIASVDRLGLLKVGPQSSGAVPGPACYGRGGTEPTVTDADLVLGYLDAASFLGGEMELRKDLAEQAVAKVGAQVGLGVTETAWGIANIVNENMAAAARIHIAEKGLDPRSFTMVATGGAGPVHAAEVARKLRVKQLLCPIAAGAGSCLGLLAAPARVDRAWSNPQEVAHLDWAEARKVLTELHADATEELRSTGVDMDTITWSLILEMRYAGQGATVGVSLPYSPITPEMAPAFVAGFEENYRKLYGSTVPDAVPQVVTWRLTGKSHTESRAFSWAENRVSAKPAAPRQRPIYLPLEKKYRPVPVYDRYSLGAGTILEAPLILEERESTLVVPSPASVTIMPDLTVSVIFGASDVH